MEDGYARLAFPFERLDTPPFEMTLAWSFELEKVLKQLRRVFVVGLDAEAQKDRRLAGIALTDDADVLRLAGEDGVDIGNRLRCHVRVDAAVRAFEGELLVVGLHEPKLPIKSDCHRSSLLVACARYGAPALCHQYRLAPSPEP